MKQTSRLIVLIITIPFLLVSCRGSVTPSVTEQATSAPEATEVAVANDQPTAIPEPTLEPTPVKDSVNIAITADFPNLDPKRSLTSTLIQYQMYDTLVRREPDGSLVPALAESWVESDDGKVITFKIREGVKFHNGDTMTVEDVAFSLNRAIPWPNVQTITNKMDHAEVVDDTHIALYLKDAFTPIYEALSVICMGIVNQEVAEKMGDDEFDKAPVGGGTGPFMFIERVSGASLTLKAFEDYWRGAPKIKNLTFTIMPDQSTSSIALENGEIDVMIDPNNSATSTLKQASGITVYETPYAKIALILMQTETGVFSNKLVRQAVAHAIDREEIILAAFDGVVDPIDSLIMPGMKYYNGNIEGPSYDLELAKKLLSDAGYPNGFTTKILVAAPRTTNVKTAEVLQAQLAKIGINLEIDMAELARYVQDMAYNNDFEMATNDVLFYYNDADCVINFTLPSWSIAGKSNYTRFNNPEMDDLIARARISKDDSERQTLYDQITKLYLEEAPSVAISPAGMSRIAANSGLKGMQPNPVQIFYVYNWSW